MSDYGHKYRLMDQMINTAQIGQWNVLSYLGLTPNILKSIDFKSSQSVTLRFEASDSCMFFKEQTVEVPMESTTEEEVEHSHTTNVDGSSKSIIGSTTKSSIKQVIKNVHEFHWKVNVKWEISMYIGSNVKEKTILKSRSSSMILIIPSDKEAPLPDHRESKPLELSLSWLLNQIDTDQMTSRFAIEIDDRRPYHQDSTPKPASRIRSGYDECHE